MLSGDLRIELCTGNKRGEIKAVLFCDIGELRDVKLPSEILRKLTEKSVSLYFHRGHVIDLDPVHRDWQNDVHGTPLYQ